jgi:hypothetical protein
MKVEMTDPSCRVAKVEDIEAPGPSAILVMFGHDIGQRSRVEVGHRVPYSGLGDQLFY